MYKEYEAIDNPDYELVKKHLDDFIDFVDECRREKRSVIVHCVAGINRSAALCVGYLVEREKMSLKDAIALCYEKRPFILTNEHFVMQLIERFI